MRFDCIIANGTLVFPDAAAPDAAAPDATTFPDAAPRDTGVSVDAGADAGVGADAGASTPGCGAAGALTGVRAETIVVGGVTRSYVLSVPASYDPSRPYALVFAFHGQGWQADIFRTATIALETAAQGNAIFVYPQALSRGGQTSWNLSTTGDDVALFDAVRGALEGRYCVDTTRRFVLGRSYGGFFTHALTCVRGTQLRAIAIFASGLLVSTYLA
jgi:poly(3-hydroxybutyrate) depolymerase